MKVGLGLEVTISQRNIKATPRIHLMLQHDPTRRRQNTLSIEDPQQTRQLLAYDKQTNNSNW